MATEVERAHSRDPAEKTEMAKRKVRREPSLSDIHPEARYQDADGKHVGRHQGVKLQRVAVEAAGDGGDGRVQDGGIQHLHEECRCHKKGQVAQRFGGCRQFFHGRPPPVSGWAAPGARQMFVPALPLFSWRPEPPLCPGLRFTAWAVPVRAAPARVWKAMRAQVRHKASGTRRPTAMQMNRTPTATGRAREKGTSASCTQARYR